MENSTSSSVQVWRFGGDPVVELDGGAEGFVYVAAGARSGDTIVVADAGTGRLHFYAMDGHLLAVTGQKGRGPGEFQFISGLGALARDSVAAWDPLLRRLTVYTLAGRRVREASPALGIGSFPDLHGVFADGSLLIAQREVSEAPRRGGVWRDTAIYLRVSRTGEVLDTLGRFPGPEQFEAPTADPHVFRTMSLPFGKSTSTAVYGSRFYVSTGRDYELAAFDTEGHPLQRIERAFAASVLTSREIAEYRQLVLDAAGDGAGRALQQRTLDVTPFPRSVSPTGALLVDERGLLWVEDGQVPSSLARGSRWSVFDAGGRWIARVEGPPRFTPLQIGADWVLGRFTDADLVSRVRLYDLDTN